MADLLLWNSIASRRRSPSDDFLDNGLAILKAYLESRGFTVEVADWARKDQWEKMTPRGLASLNRRLASLLLSGKDSPAGFKKMAATLAGPLFRLSQELTSGVQKRRIQRMLRELALRVRYSGCQVVGIKTWYGEAFTNARYFAGCVRKLVPEALIVAGGPHASVYREALLEAAVFDLAVAGEGEKALAAILALSRRSTTRTQLLREIAEEVRRGNLKNVIYRTGKGAMAAGSEYADANDKFVSNYDSLDGKTLVHVVVDSLGCPWAKCSFCVHSCIYERHSLRNPEAVVAEIEGMTAKGIGLFRFAGSSTLLSHARQIAERIEARGLHVVYSMFGRAETGAGNPEVYERLVESYHRLLRSGLRAIFIGAESADDRINEQVMHKGLKRSDIIYTVHAIREASAISGLPVDIGLSLIYPAPTLGEVPLERLKAENVELVEQAAPDSVLVSPPAPFPGTDWFKEKGRFGFEFGEDFLHDMLEYDYVLYKPPSLWPDIGLKLEGLSLARIFAECQDLRKSLEDRGFVTEVTDEHFLMMRSAGYLGKEAALTFKRQVLLSLLSCDYRWINRLQERVNEASRAQAFLNRN